MNKLSVNETTATPKVVFDYENHIIQISGESRPENVLKFYMPLLLWIDDYEKYLKELKENSTIAVVFHFDYINSSSSLCLKQILEKLQHIKEVINNIEIMVSWVTEKGDENMLEAGKELEKMVPKLQFNFKEEALN